MSANWICGAAQRDYADSLVSIEADRSVLEVLNTSLTRAATLQASEFQQGGAAGIFFRGGIVPGNHVSGAFAANDTEP